MELCLKEIIKDVDINLYDDIIGILNTNKIEKFIKVNDDISYNIGGFWTILSHRLSECLNKPEDLKEDQEEKEENYDKKLLIEFIELNKSKVTRNYTFKIRWMKAYCHLWSLKIKWIIF